MKKIIAILGVVALSATVFLNVQSFSTDSDVDSMNLSSLLELNSANAEDSEGDSVPCRTHEELSTFPIFRRSCASCNTALIRWKKKSTCLNVFVPF